MDTTKLPAPLGCGSNETLRAFCEGVESLGERVAADSLGWTDDEWQVAGLAVLALVGKTPEVCARFMGGPLRNAFGFTPPTSRRRRPPKVPGSLILSILRSGPISIGQAVKAIRVATGISYSTAYAALFRLEREGLFVRLEGEFLNWSRPGNSRRIGPFGLKRGRRPGRGLKISEHHVRQALTCGPMTRRDAVARLVALSGAGSVSAYAVLSNRGRFKELISQLLPGGFLPDGRFKITRELVRQALQSGPMTRNGAVARLCALAGCSHNSAYEALCTHGRFKSWIRIDPDGRLSWYDAENTEARGMG